MRIKRLSLNNFRAFPGPGHHFDLKGKNLLVYGENGAGKSSVFHALRAFFSFRPWRVLGFYNNVFSGLTDCSVQVEFMDGSTAVWDGTGHPGNIAAGNQTVKDAALYRSCLDYKSLLETNLSHGPDEINLFDIAVRRLLHSYSVTVAGGTSKTVRELWNDVRRALDDIQRARRVSQRMVDNINAACATFNDGFRQAIVVLPPHIKTLLSDLLHADIDIGNSSFPGVTYNQGSRNLDGMTLTLPVQFRTHPLDRPQYFLNEARLSALGLAIYLAGRLACVPAGTTANILKLLVLDDVLIGLDHSNRLPVLEVLQKHFSDWQIILLTHDRVWFDMADDYLEPSKQWEWCKIFEHRDGPIPSPFIQPKNPPVNGTAATYFAQAQDFFTNHHDFAAATYARIAFEMATKKFCDNKKIPIRYHENYKNLKTEDLLDGILLWIPGKAPRWNGLVAKVNAVKVCRNVVLNPYSHAAPPTLASAEIKNALDAVDDLMKAMSAKDCP